MKNPLLVFFAIAVTAVAHADNYGHTKSFNLSNAFEAGGTLSIENTNGAINIRTWDRNEILIEGTKRARTEEELELIELKTHLTDSRAEIRVHFGKRPNSGWFGSNQARGRVDMTVTVPVTAVLQEVKTVNGTVSIDGIHGNVTASSVNGSIDATGLGGDARIKTVNGQVKVSFGEIAAGTDLDFETVNGSITVRLPADTGVAVDGSVVNGSIESDLPLTVQGRIDRKHIKGSIGDGRASLSVRAVNGSIKLAASN
jgi:hypothetical protein